MFLCPQVFGQRFVQRLWCNQGNRFAEGSRRRDGVAADQAVDGIVKPVRAFDGIQKVSHGSDSCSSLRAKAFHLAGTGIDDVEELATLWHYPVARGALRWGGAGKPEAKRDGHIAALVYCERYIIVSALTWGHGRLQSCGLFIFTSFADIHGGEMSF